MLTVWFYTNVRLQYFDKINDNKYSKLQSCISNSFHMRLINHSPWMTLYNLLYLSYFKKCRTSIMQFHAYVIHLFELKNRISHRYKTVEVRSLIKIFSLSTGNGYKERPFVCNGSYFRNSFGGNTHSTTRNTNDPLPRRTNCCKSCTLISSALWNPYCNMSKGRSR